MVQPARSISPGTERDLYARSGAARWKVSVETFGARLQTSVSHRFKDGPTSVPSADAFAKTLHVEDLALACACAAGHEEAWEHFIRELRPGLYAAGRAITHHEGSRELVDSLFAELYGVDARGSARRSLLDYYHGRSRLATWLRTVLAQRHVDAWRASSRTVPLEEGEDAQGRVEAQPDDPYRQRYVALAQRALDAAVAALDPRDRLRLRLYYGEGLKLAKIGRLLGEHEATISRKLDRARRDIRHGIERALRQEHGLSTEAVQECLEHAAGAPELDLSRMLAADDG